MAAPTVERDITRTHSQERQDRGGTLDPNYCTVIAIFDAIPTLEPEFSSRPIRPSEFETRGFLAQDATVITMRGPRVENDLFPHSVTETDRISVRLFNAKTGRNAELDFSPFSGLQYAYINRGNGHITEWTRPPLVATPEEQKYVDKEGERYARWIGNIFAGGRWQRLPPREVLSSTSPHQLPEMFAEDLGMYALNGNGNNTNGNGHENGHHPVHKEPSKPKTIFDGTKYRSGNHRIADARDYRNIEDILPRI